MSSGVISGVDAADGRATATIAASTIAAKPSRRRSPRLLMPTFQTGSPDTGNAAVASRPADHMLAAKANLAGDSAGGCLDWQGLDHLSQLRRGEPGQVPTLRLLRGGARGCRSPARAAQGRVDSLLRPQRFHEPRGG